MYDGKLDGTEHFLSFIQGDRTLIEQAATDTGLDVFVSDTNDNGETSVLSGEVAVWTRETRDHGPFWARLRELRNAEAQIRPALDWF